MEEKNCNNCTEFDCRSKTLSGNCTIYINTPPDVRSHSFYCSLHKLKADKLKAKPELPLHLPEHVLSKDLVYTINEIIDYLKAREK